MTKRAPLPLELGTAFRASAARNQGVSDGRLRAADLSAPFHGTRAIGVPSSTFELARAYSSKMITGQFFSHLTAAELLGMRLPEHFIPGIIHVTSIDPLRAVRARGVVGHTAERTRFVRLSDLLVTAPINTWLDCAQYLSLDDVIVMGDGLVRRKHPQATLAELRQAVESRRGARGYLTLSRAMKEIRSNSDSARETKLRLVLTRAGFPEPEVNGEILNESGIVIAHGDLVFREFKVVVEYDGGQHRLDEVQFDIDIERLDAIRCCGFAVERVGKRLMGNRPRLLAKVTATMISRGFRPKRLKR